MADYPPATNITTLGAVATTLTTPALSSMTLDNDGKVFIAVKNGSGASINVTVAPVKTVADSGGNIALASRVVAVAAGALAFLGPYPPDIFNNLSTNQVTISFSAVTTVTTQAFRLNV